VTQYTSGSSEATEVRWEFQKGSRIYYSVQAVYTHEDEGSNGGRTNPIGAVICAGRISGHLEGECVGGPGGRVIKI